MQPTLLTHWSIAGVCATFFPINTVVKSLDAVIACDISGRGGTTTETGTKNRCVATSADVVITHWQVLSVGERMLSEEGERKHGDKQHSVNEESFEN